VLYVLVYSGHAWLAKHVSVVVLAPLNAERSSELAMVSRSAVLMSSSVAAAAAVSFIMMLSVPLGSTS
jgi:hypothetical protein